jgi:hypothetical protein
MFFPGDAVRVAALSGYVDHRMSACLLQRPPEETMAIGTIAPLVLCARREPLEARIT